MPRTEQPKPSRPSYNPYRAFSSSHIKPSPAGGGPQLKGRDRRPPKHRAIHKAAFPCSRCLEQSNPSPADPPTIPIEPFQVQISSPLQRGGPQLKGWDRAIHIAPSPCSRCLEQSNPSPEDPPTIPIEPFQVHISSPLQRGGDLS